jgi:superfamily I DNA/RNA helicase
MQFDNQKTRNVADVAAKIMASESAVEKEPEMLEEALKGNQHKIDANKNNKVDAEDFKILRGEKKMKEETEQVDEAMFPGTKEYDKKYGQTPQQKLKKVGDKEKTSSGEMEKTAGGVKHTRRFSEMLETYKEGGLKTIAEMLVKEEPDNEQYTKELDMQKKKASEKKSPEDEARVAQAKVDSVKVEEEVEQVEEREMTDAEMKERERIVKGMKKGMAGFKDRYGERAKSVMYATATKTAMKD